MALGKHELKLWWYTVTHLLKRLNDRAFKCWQSSGNNWTLTAGGNVKWYGMENEFVISSKGKHTPTIWLSQSTHNCWPKRNANVCPQKDFWIKVYNSDICKSQTSETTQMSINRWVDKETRRYLYCGEPLSNLKEQTIAIHNNMDESQNKYAVREHTKKV